MDYQTKDSGDRNVTASGYMREPQGLRPDFYLLLPKDIPYDQQLITKCASLMSRGREKYSARNWELSCTQEDLERYKSSALRHMYQWLCDEKDECHEAAVVFNIMGAEYVKYKLNKKE